MSRILITGVNGFVGKHLAVVLKTRSVQVIGVSREATLHPSLNAIVDAYHVCDLTSVDDVARLPLEGVDVIINLAGLAAVGASYGQDELYSRVNVGVLSIIGQRILDLGLKTRMLAVSTGAVYSPDQPMPLNEDSKLITSGSPYALSKIAMEKEASRLRSLGLSCAVARPFNHIGPGQEPGFLVPDLYQKMCAAIESNGTVPVGDLTTKRDYTDVRDVVRAYADLAMAPIWEYEIYNICSGHSIAGNVIFDLLKQSISGAEAITPEVNPEFIRPGDPKELYGDNSHLQKQTGWAPKIALETTLRDFVQSKK